jgi:hypothetical protein
MRAFRLLTSISLIAFFVPGNANACGDKLLLLSRGIRFERSVSAHPASVLMFVRPSSRTATIAADSQPALEQAGHKIRIVRSIDEIAGTLNSTAYDLLLADIEDIPAIEQRIGSMSSRPVLVPVVYKGWKQDSVHAMQYVPVSLGKVGNYVSAIDKAMKLKLKRQKS